MSTHSGDADFIVVNLLVEIKQVSDGTISSKVWKDWHWYPKAGAYWWKDGNASCDCNRKSFFNEGLELPTINIDSEDEDFPCGNGEYTLRLTNQDTGEVLYSEFEKEPNAAI